MSDKITKKEHMTEYQLLEQYDKGRRDFSNIIMNTADVLGRSLRGIILKNAVLESVMFEEIDFTDADFSGAKMNNCGVKYCKLKNAKFRNMVLYWGSFQGSEFDNTDFSGAEISNACFQDTERFAANFEGAVLEEVWWSLDDFSLPKIDELISKVNLSEMPLDAKLRVIKTLEVKREKLLGVAPEKKDFQTTSDTAATTYGSSNKNKSECGFVTYGGSPSEGTYAASGSEHAYGAGFKSKKNPFKSEFVI